MNAYNWMAFLKKWSREAINFDEYRKYLSPEMIASEWLGYSGATEEQIEKIENRLGTKLPLSYREFLKVTNGWRLIGSINHELLPVEHIDWLYIKNQKLIDSWMAKEGYIAMTAPISDEEYFLYGDGQDSTSVRGVYLKTALQISNWKDSSIFLLNPQVLFENEWETWFYASWLPGANRYRSFWEMMQMEYKIFIEMREDV